MSPDNWEGVWESPWWLGWLFKPSHTHQLLHDLEEVIKLVIRQFILTSALANNTTAMVDMNHQLWARWMYSQDELVDALHSIESLRLESLMAGELYLRYQQQLSLWLPPGYTRGIASCNGATSSETWYPISKWRMASWTRNTMVSTFLPDNLTIPHLRHQSDHEICHRCCTIL